MLLCSKLDSHYVLAMAADAKMLLKEWKAEPCLYNVPVRIKNNLFSGKCSYYMLIIFLLYWLFGGNFGGYVSMFFTFNQKSEAMKETGNQLFEKKQYGEAIKFYTEAIKNL